MAEAMMANQVTRRVRRSRCPREVACQRCGLYALCVLAGLHDPQSQLLDQMLVRRRPVPKGGLLFCEGDPFHAVYAVKSGAFKTCTAIDGHQVQVIGFHLPGELVGLEAIRDGRHAFSARALEPSRVCELSFEHLDRMDDRIATFQEELVRGLSGQLAQVRWSVSLARRASTEARLAAFLLDLSSRYAEHGLPAREFRIPMSRYEIASFLGLAVETVCRLFQRFQSRGLLVASGKYTRLCDLNGLRALGGI